MLGPAVLWLSEPERPSVAEGGIGGVGEFCALQLLDVPAGVPDAVSRDDGGAGGGVDRDRIGRVGEVDRIAFVDTGQQGPSGAILCVLTILRLSTAEPIFAGIVPFQGGNKYGPLVAWGKDGLVWRDAGFNAFNTVASRLYIFRSY